MRGGPMTSDIRSIAPATGSDFTRANCLNNAREASAFIGLPRFSKNVPEFKKRHGASVIRLRDGIAKLLDS